MSDGNVSLYRQAMPQSDQIEHYRNVCDYCSKVDTAKFVATLTQELRPALTNAQIASNGDGIYVESCGV